MAAPLRSLRMTLPSPSASAAAALVINIEHRSSRRAHTAITWVNRNSAYTSSAQERRGVVSTRWQRLPAPPTAGVGLRRTVGSSLETSESRLFSSEAAHTATGPSPSPLFGDDVIVTKRCAERLNELREAKSQPGLRLRLTVEGGGCSGFQYKFALEDAAAAAAEAAKEGDAHDDSDDEDGGDVDHEFERNGAVLVVDETSLGFVKGATVDFEEDMMRSAFAVINNPVSESACGCGSSFAIKNFEKNPALD